MRTEAQKRAEKKYKAANDIAIPLRYNRSTDADVIEVLDMVENKADYIKELIRRDMRKVVK